MSIQPQSYTKESFLEYLLINNVPNNIIENFKALPEVLNNRNSEFKLLISSTLFTGSDMSHTTFELNYYSEDLIEFLFSYKIFDHVERSINYLLCELTNKNFL